MIKYKTKINTMKLYFKINLFLALFLSFLMSGCLKDKDYEDGLIQSVHSNGDQKIIEIGVTTTSTSNFLQLAFNPTDNDTVLNLIPVTLASANPASEDINVTLVSNPALIGNYNALNGSIHEEAPSSVYTLLNPVSSDGGVIVTIPKGSHTGYLQIKIKKSNYLGHDYAFAYQISKIDKPGYLISTNLGTGIVAVGIKNKWDAVYRSKGSFVHPNAAFTSSWTYDDGIIRELITFSQYGVYIYPLETKAVTFGVELDLTVNADNTVSTVFLGTTDDLDAVPNPSHYDVATKTFFIDAYYGGHTRHLIDTLQYVRER